MTVLSRSGIVSDTAAKMRRDLISGGRWVIFNPGRGQRPRQFSHDSPTKHSTTTNDKKAEPLKYLKSCPFCVGNEHITPPALLTLDEQCNIISNNNNNNDGKGNAGDNGSPALWATRVVCNAFPAVTPFDDALLPASASSPSSPSTTAKNVGDQSGSTDDVTDADEGDSLCVATNRKRDLMRHMAMLARDVAGGGEVLSTSATAGDHGLEIPAIGHHEVVIESRNHDLLFSSSSCASDQNKHHQHEDDEHRHRYTYSHVRRFLRAWHYRGTSLRDSDPLLRQILYFKNNGAVAGASLEHAHSQIVALPIVGQETDRMMTAHLRYFNRTQRNMFDDCLEQARDKAVDLVVHENEHFVAAVPFAALSPFTVRVFSKQLPSPSSSLSDAAAGFAPPPPPPPAHFENETPDRVDACAEVLAAALQKIDKHLRYPDFNIVLTTPPLEGRFERAAYCADVFSRWFITLTPRLGVGAMAGFELGSGVMSNSTLPEDSAKILRETKI